MSRTGHRRYRRNRDRLKRRSDTCWLCGQPIDPELSWPDPMSFSSDHVDAVALTGDNFGELRASHLVCNQKRGTGQGQNAGTRRHVITW